MGDCKDKADVIDLLQAVMVVRREFAGRGEIAQNKAGRGFIRRPRSLFPANQETGQEEERGSGLLWDGQAVAGKGANVSDKVGSDA